MDSSVSNTPGGYIPTRYPARGQLDVLTRTSSVIKALRAVGIGLLDKHLRHCVHNAAADGDDACDVKISEAAAAVDRLLRS